MTCSSSSSSDSMSPCSPAAPLGLVAEDLLEEGLDGPGRGVAVLDAERRVAEEAGAVVVAEQHPEADRRLVYGVVLAHRLVRRVGVEGEGRIEGVVGDGL